MPPTPSTGKPGEQPAHLKPGDEAQPGTLGAGEDLCEVCGGTGVSKDGEECPNCEGTGRVMHGIGGG